MELNDKNKKPFMQNSIPGGAWVRFWATIIDETITILPSFLLGIILSAIFISPISFQGNIFFHILINPIVGISLLVIYTVYVVYLTSKKGATFGKDAYGLKVVKYKTNILVPYHKVFLRELIKKGILIIPIIGSLFYFTNGLMIIFSPEKRGIHDLIAGTQVIKVNKQWSIKKQLIVFGLIILAGVLVFGIGWFLDKNINGNKLRVERSISANPSNWALFEDKIDGWSIKYDTAKFSKPSVPDIAYRQKHYAGQSFANEITFSRKSSLESFCNDSFIINTLENSNNLPLGQWLESQQLYKTGAAEVISINGIEGLKITLAYSSGLGINGKMIRGNTSTIYYLIPGKNKVFVLQYGDSGQLQYPEQECKNNGEAIQGMFETFKPL